MFDNKYENEILMKDELEEVEKNKNEKLKIW
jgi:hypothetical protein